MMNETIWQILKTKETTDKKAIRRAYAKEARNCHPEEKPEEFCRLYDAYQQALEYAGQADQLQKSLGDSIPVESRPMSSQDESVTQEDRHPPAPPTEADVEAASEKEKIIRMFRCREEEQIQKYRVFYQNLRNYLDNTTLPGAREAFLEYLKTGEFREIKDEEQVLDALWEGIDGKWYIKDDVRLAIGEPYGFQESGQDWRETKYLPLYHTILPALKRREEKQKERDAEEKAQILAAKRRKYFLKWGPVAAVFLILAVAGGIMLRRIGEKNEALTYLQNTYPQQEFSSVKRMGKDTGGIITFQFQASPFPGETFRLTMEKESLSSGGSMMDGKDDLGPRLTESVSKRYGLNCTSEIEPRKSHYKRCPTMIAYYDGTGGIDRFCGKFEEFISSDGFQSLSHLEQIIFCPENILYPEQVINGSESGLPKRQVWMLNEIPSGEDLRAYLLEQYMTYMYSYEPWNLTQEEKDAYEDFYLKAAQAAGRSDHVLTGFTAGSTPEEMILHLEAQTGAYIHWFQKEVYYSSLGVTREETRMTIGNFYLLLTAGGVPVTVSADGSGFSVMRNGQVFLFGRGVKDTTVSCSDAVGFLQ